MMTRGILLCTVALAITAHTLAQDAAGHLEDAQQLLLKAKEKLRRDQDSMASQKKKLQADLDSAVKNMRLLKEENGRLRMKLREMDLELKEIQEEARNPSVRDMLQISLDNANEYLHGLESFEDVEDLADDIEARMSIVFGKENSWSATVAVIAMVVFVPALTAIYVLRRIVKLVSPSAYAATFATVMFVYVIGVEVVAIFTGSDPFQEFRSVSPYWFVTSQWGLAVVGVMFLYLTVSLALGESMATVRLLHLGQGIIFVTIAVDYGARVFLPAVKSQTLQRVHLHILVLYVVATAAILLIALRIESLKQNLRPGPATEASKALFEENKTPLVAEGEGDKTV